MSKPKTESIALTAAERKLLAKLLQKAGTPTPVDTGPVIETPRIATGSKRKNTSRNFWTDGTNAYLRRKKASPAMRERVDSKVQTGEYKHVRTSDNVEIYQIADWSNLRRRKIDITECSPAKLERYIVQAACKGDYRLYYDAASEYAHRVKNSDLPPGTAQLMYQTQMQYIERRIYRRGGPSPMTLQAEVAKIRKERTGSRLYLPRTSIN